MGLEINTKYLIPFGAVKIAEIVCLLIAWATMADAFSMVKVGYRPSKINFFLAICVLGWIFCIVWFFCNLFKLFDKINIPSRHIVFGIIHICGGVLVLIAGALAASLDLRRCYYSVGWLNCETDPKATAGAAFGIISAIILVADGIFHFVLGNRPGAAPAGAGVPTA